MTSSAPQQAPGRPTSKKPPILGLIVLLVLIAASACAASGSSSSSSEAAGSSTDSSSDISMATTTEAAPTTTEAPPPIATPVTYNGSGDDVLSIQKPDAGPAVLAAFTYRGRGNFIVIPMGGSGMSLVNTIGAYSGTRLLDADGGNTTQLQIKASGPWTVTLSDIRSAPELTSAGQTGNGDSVLIYRGIQAAATITSNGTGNFIVQEYGSGMSVVNEIGHYQGTVPISAGPELVVVTADGPWSIAIRN